jgi:hypothetical protein
MIDTHHLAYAGVLLVFLAGAAIVAISAFLILGTVWLTVIGVRFIKCRTPHKENAIGARTGPRGRLRAQRRQTSARAKAAA